MFLYFLYLARPNNFPPPIVLSNSLPYSRALIRLIVLASKLQDNNNGVDDLEQLNFLEKEITNKIKKTANLGERKNKREIDSLVKQICYPLMYCDSLVCDTIRVAMDLRWSFYPRSE